MSIYNIESRQHQDTFSITQRTLITLNTLCNTRNTFCIAQYILHLLIHLPRSTHHSIPSASFNMLKATLLLLASCSISTALSLRQTAEVCTAGDQIIDGRFCSVSCGKDRAGGDYDQHPVSGISACAKLCADDTRCSTAQYAESNGYCYLKDVRHDLVDHVTVDSIDCAVCTAETKIINGRTCTTKCGTERAGGNIGDAIQVGSISACATACSNNANCVTAQYHEGTGYCYLKGVRNEERPDPSVESIDCEPLSGTTPAPSTPTTPTCTEVTVVYDSESRVCTLRCATDRPGGDYASRQAATAQDCMDACVGDSNCMTAQFANNYCYLKNTLNAFTSNDNVQTIDCTSNSGVSHIHRTDSLNYLTNLNRTVKTGLRRRHYKIWATKTGPTRNLLGLRHHQHLLECVQEESSGMTRTAFDTNNE
jgi:hypothetical protein